jgi:hypothetical protein
MSASLNLVFADAERADVPSGRRLERAFSSYFFETEEEFTSILHAQQAFPINTRLCYERPEPS